MRAKREAEESQNAKVESEYLTERAIRHIVQKPKYNFFMQNKVTDISQNIKLEQQSDPTLS